MQRAQAEMQAKLHAEMEQSQLGMRADYKVRVAQLQRDSEQVSPGRHCHSTLSLTVWLPQGLATADPAVNPS